MELLFDLGHMGDPLLFVEVTNRRGLGLAVDQAVTELCSNILRSVVGVVNRIVSGDGWSSFKESSLVEPTPY